MKVRMKVQISGTRDGADWPAPGEVVTLPDFEGARLCANGSAVPVAVDKVERADAPEAEKRRARKA